MKRIHLIVFGIFISFLIAAPRVLADQAPDGWHDAADGSACTVNGWACDNDKPSQPIEVEFYRLIPGGSPGFIGKYSAPNQRESAVGDRCGGDANHGFSYRLPMFFNDNETYDIEAHAIGIDANGNPDGTTTPLGGNPQSIRCAYAPFLGLQEVEPNDSPSFANGPIELGRIYTGQHDERDYFKVYLTQGQQIRATLENTDSNGVQFIMYSWASTLTAYKQAPPYAIDYNISVSGWYYFFVYTDPTKNNISPYTFHVYDLNTPTGTSAPPPPIDGDYDNNRVVNASDFMQLINAFWQTNPLVNLIYPSTIDIFDYTMFISNYGIDYR